MSKLIMGQQVECIWSDHSRKYGTHSKQRKINGFFYIVKGRLCFITDDVPEGVPSQIIVDNNNEFTDIEIL